MIPAPVDATWAELLAALDEARMSYALMGGYAVVTWGVPRATYDIDVLLASGEQDVPRFFTACERRGFTIDDAYRKGWRDRLDDMLLLKVHLFRGGRMVATDLFPVATPFQRSAFAHRVMVDIPALQRSAPVVSAADLLLFKLLADRPKDRADVVNLLTVQGLPDESYLRDWAGRLRVEDRLERALADAGIA